MKTLKSKPVSPLPLKKTLIRRCPIFFTSVLFFLSFVFSGSTLLPQKEIEKIKDSKSKKVDILEKLERGITISSADIRASFGQSAYDDHEYREFSLPVDHPFQGPFIYRYHEGRDHVIISESDMKEIHDQLHESIEEVRNEIELFRNSEDFLKMKEELQKWSEKFRKEMGKMKEELLKSEKEAGIKDAVHSLL